MAEVKKKTNTKVRKQEPFKELIKVQQKEAQGSMAGGDTRSSDITWGEI